MKKQVCRICEKSLYLDYFQIRTDTGATRSECKKCNNVIKRKYPRKRDPVKRVQETNDWRKRNPDKMRAMSSLRRARQKGATPKWLTRQQLSDIGHCYKLAVSREMFENQKFDVDHIVPLAGKTVCGLHVPWNLQVIPKTQNMKKHNKLIK